MNKLELIETLRKDTRLTKAESKAVIKTFFGTITDALVKGNRVEIRGLCSFYVKKYKAYS